MNLSRALYSTCTAAIAATTFAATALAVEQKEKQRDEKAPAEATPAAAVSEPAKDASGSWLGNFGLAFIYENAVGLGTFTTTGDSAQPYWNMSYSIRPSYTISKEYRLKTSLRIDLDQNIVENYNSGNTRPHQVQLYDIRLGLTQAGVVGLSSDSFGPIDDEGKRGDFLSVDWGFSFAFPTAKASQVSNKIIGLSGSIAASFQPVNWFSLAYTFGVTKNFNQYSNQTLDTSNLSLPLPSRAGGAEQVSESLVALSGANLEWALSQDLTASFSFPVGLGDMGVAIGWTYFQNYTYLNLPKDEYSLSIVKPGRGNSDLMRGVFEVSWSPLAQFGVALGWLVDQSPKTSDGESFRFPWWDTTNGSENRQSFYLDLTASF